MENKQYSEKYGKINNLSDKDIQLYREFAQAVYKMSDEDLMKLSMGHIDDLTSEQHDIISWTMKIRELEDLEAMGVDPNTAFSPKNFGYDQREHVDGMELPLVHINKFRHEEKKLLREMSDDLLERSKQIIENTPMRVHQSDLHNIHGGGVNLMCKKYIVVCDNGEEIEINNEELQKHFRKQYLKKMSDITGIDYTRFDNDGIFDETEPEVHRGEAVIFDENEDMMQHLNFNDFEDD